MSVKAMSKAESSYSKSKKLVKQNNHFEYIKDENIKCVLTTFSRSLEASLKFQS